jgi:O-antigen/teichoic acid export membrane protein
MAAGGARINLPDLVAPVLSRIGQLAAAFATIKISTTLLSPAEVGSVNQLNSSAMLLATVLLLPVIAYFTRGVGGWILANLFEAHARTMLRFIALSALALSAAGVVLQWGWGFIQDVSIAWVGMLLLAYLIGFPGHNLLINFTAVLGQRQQTAIFSNVAAWLGLAAAMVLYFQFKTAEAWFLGICVGFMATALVCGIYLGKMGRSATGLKLTGSTLPFDTISVLRFIWPQVVVGVLWWVQSQSYRFQLAEISSLATVGLFFAGYALCSVPMQAFEGAVNEYYLPMLYAKTDVASSRPARRSWWCWRWAASSRQWGPYCCGPR